MTLLCSLFDSYATHFYYSSCLERQSGAGFIKVKMLKSLCIVSSFALRVGLNAGKKLKIEIRSNESSICDPACSCRSLAHLAGLRANSSFSETNYPLGGMPCTSGLIGAAVDRADGGQVYVSVWSRIFLVVNGRFSAQFRVLCSTVMNMGLTQRLLIILKIHSRAEIVLLPPQLDQGRSSFYVPTSSFAAAWPRGRFSRLVTGALSFSELEKLDRDAIISQRR